MATIFDNFVLAFCPFLSLFRYFSKVIKRLTGRYYTADTNLRKTVSNCKSKSQKKSRLQLLQKKITEVVELCLTPHKE